MTKIKPMRVGVVRFPGSNCDFDTIKYFERFGHKPFFIWFKDTELPKLDLLVLPGGFAFGDRVYEKATAGYTIDPGTQAMTSPVMKVVYEAAEKKLPILGICNGFQILVKAGFLQGKLEHNDVKQFYCDFQKCKITGKSFFNDKSLLDKTFNIPVAHGYGKYVISEEEYQDLEKNEQIFLKYDGNNPNGSYQNIAGICNKEGNIFGMMPHPERSPDGAHSMRAIEKYVAQKSIPLELAEAMSSEHTSYKSTKKILEKLPTTGEYIIQGPGENAGIVDIGDGWALAFRTESHNHPSFIKPYHGAATGIGGILRDIFTMGARPIALLDLLRFGTDEKAKQLLPEVVRGIADYGNCIGVPTVGGDIFFDETYNHNCLVNVAAFGLVKKENIIYGNALTVGNDLIYVGARTGRDGIGGAQMASENLDTMNEATVQTADPFLEKLLLEACCELAETEWIEGMQDMGAAGLLCSTTEVVLRGRKKTGLNLGSKVYLNRVPTKASNLSPVEMLLSESQERMMIVGKREHREKILNLFKHWDLEAVIVGEITNDGKYTIVYDESENENITLTMDFDKILPDVYEDWEPKEWVEQKTEHINPSQEQKTAIWQQYDWMVGIRTLKGPNKPGHFAVLDLPEIGKELVISWSSDEGKSNINPKKGVEYAFDKCLEKMQDLNAKPLALVNCLNFGHPENSFGALKETVEGLTKRCLKHNIPVVGGNVSLYNAHKEHSIKPTPVIMMVGLKEK